MNVMCFMNFELYNVHAEGAESTEREMLSILSTKIHYMTSLSFGILPTDMYQMLI